MRAVKAVSPNTIRNVQVAAGPLSAFAGAAGDADDNFWDTIKKEMFIDYHHYLPAEYIFLGKQNLQQK